MRRYHFDLTLDEPEPGVDLVIEVDTPEQMDALVETLLGHPPGVPCG